MSLNKKKKKCNKIMLILIKMICFVKTIIQTVKPV